MTRSRAALGRVRTNEEAVWLVAVDGAEKVGMVFGEFASGEVNVRVWIRPNPATAAISTAALRNSRSEMAAYFPGGADGRARPRRRLTSAALCFGAPPPNWDLEFVTFAPMATLFSSATRLTSLLAVVMVSASLNACTPKPNGPEPAADEFFAALAKGDTGSASQLTDRPEDARDALNEAWAGLQATSLDAQVLGSKFTEDTGTVLPAHLAPARRTAPGPTTAS